MIELEPLALASRRVTSHRACCNRGITDIIMIMTRLTVTATVTDNHDPPESSESDPRAWNVIRVIGSTVSLSGQWPPGGPAAGLSTYPSQVTVCSLLSQ